MGHAVAEVRRERRDRTRRRSAGCKVVAQGDAAEFIGLDKLGDDEKLPRELIDAVCAHDVGVIAEPDPCLGLGPEALAHAGSACRFGALSTRRSPNSRCSTA